jgi:Fe-S oxidoreductase
MRLSTELSKQFHFYGKDERIDSSNCWIGEWGQIPVMRASLFITCYNDTLFPETGRAVVRLLERLGVELDFHPRQTCCGQMHANTGFRGEAFCQAKRFVRLYQDTEAVVIPSSSCVAMILKTAVA